MLDLVDSYKDIIKNSKEFNNKINDELINKLSFFRYWYYIEEIDSFAPSKFIGYKNVTVESYKIGTSLKHGYMDGRETVPKLNKWFKEIEDDDFDTYYNKLNSLLFQYNKSPNKKIKLYYKK